MLERVSPELIVFLNPPVICGGERASKCNWIRCIVFNRSRIPVSLCSLSLSSDPLTFHAVVSVTVALFSFPEQNITTETHTKNSDLHLAALALIVLINLAVHDILIVISKGTLASNLLAPGLLSSRGIVSDGGGEGERGGEDERELLADLEGVELVVDVQGQFHLVVLAAGVDTRDYRLEVKV